MTQRKDTRAAGHSDDGAETARRTPRWHWVGADPDDTSPEADFRREVAAVTRRVLLARGADPADVPPLERTVSRSGHPGAALGADVGDGGEPSVVDGSGRGTPASTGAGPATQPPDYYDIRSTASFALAAAFRAVRSAVESADTATGSMAAGLTLLAIARSSRGVTLARLVKSGELAQSTASTIVARLVEDGLVARRRHPADRRRWVFQATPVGLQEAERLAVIWRHLDHRFVAALSVTECEELTRLLRRAGATLSLA